MATIHIRNVDQVARKLEAMARAAGESNVSGLRVIGETILTDVKASRPGHGVPVDTGALRASGRVEGPQQDVVKVTFGGAATEYALRQHEELSYRHPVGEARFLVRGLERFLDGGKVRDALKANAQAGIRAAQRTR